MKLQELRREIDEINKIFLSAKNYELDFRYINSVKLSLPLVYSTFHLFIERIYHSVTVLMILNLSKLFDKREKYSLIKLKNKMIDNYANSELNSYLSINEVEYLFDSIDSERIESLLKKLKATRDNYYAHFDRTRPDFSEIRINSSETGLLISIAEKLLNTIELIYFNKSTNYDLTIEELGHNIFERINEWEKYREMYGLIAKNKKFNKSQKS